MVLEKEADGTFLVREKEDHQLVISVKYVSVEHVRIMKTNDGYFLIENKTFKSLADLIGFYQSNTLGDAFEGLPIQLGVCLTGENCLQ